MPILLARAAIYAPSRFQTGLKPELTHGWRHPESQVAFCFGQSTKLAESGVAASVPRSSGAWLKRKQRSVRFQDWRPMTSAGPVPVSVIKQAVSWSKYNSSWDMSLCKQPSGTSDANSASTTLLMIGSGSNRIRRDLRRFRLTGRLSGLIGDLELRNGTDSAVHLSGNRTIHPCANFPMSNSRSLSRLDERAVFSSIQK